MKDVRALTMVGLVLAAFGLIWLVALALRETPDRAEIDAAPATSVIESVAASAESGASVETAVTAPQRDASGATTTPRADPAVRSRLARLVPIAFEESDLGTGSTEFSGVALNEASNRLLIVDDSGRLFELDLAGDGTPRLPPRRSMDVALGTRDIEAIAWLGDSTYAIADEGLGAVFVVDLDDGDVEIGDRQVQRRLTTGVGEIDGNGVEGVAVGPGDGLEFWVVDERPPTLVGIGFDGLPARTVPLALGIEDASDVWAHPDGTILVLSDESRRLVELVVDPLGNTTVLGSLDLDLDEGRFEQPEGVAMSRDGTRLYVVGESPGPGRFSLGYFSLGDE